MKTIFSEKLPRIIKNKKELERILGVKIKNKGKNVFIEGEPDEEYIAIKVIDALNFGFPFSEAIKIKKDDYVLEILSIKDYTKRTDLKRIKGRIIGRGGKSIRNLSRLTNCSIEIKDNQVGIIGKPENIENAINSVIRLISGSKHSNVYSYLEKHRPEFISEDEFERIYEKK